MYLLTYSFISSLDHKLRHRSVVTRDWTGALARRREQHDKATLSVVFLTELPSLGVRRLAELKAAGVEVEQ